MVMAVSFTRHGRLHYLDPGSYTPRVGDKVLVPTDTGPEVAECVWGPQHVPEEVGGLPVCAGTASEKHLERDERNRHRKAEARVTAKRLIREHALPMKVVGVDYLDAREPDHDLLLGAAPGGLPLPRSGPRPGARGADRLAAAGGARRGEDPGRYRPVRTGPVLRHLSERLRAGHLADGQGPGFAAQPAQDLRRLRPVDVLP